ncbi:hypothetical protein LPB140_09470 [Sphingorhabdus lutea]|uniref:ABC-type uncharacterized transport system domain-containing protein n=1 Tax=Sphingorhabdus lutea TaxID=1913578 RepID=A0A1L3JCW3_9SPHN|nr:Gldg family protein [Sphingorhabdus lutea]APG62981.1 hypothetical protein LPB140_09470 [Sphingorhabdus lutea]
MRDKKIILGMGLSALLLLVAAYFGANYLPKQKQLPPLLLMSSIPMAMGEGDPAMLLSGEAKPYHAFVKLSEDYDVQQIDDLAILKTSKTKIIMLAQPRALSPEELVILDDWIAKGGRALFLADPALAVESKYPIGDKRRPVFTSLLSPLFKHWGLEMVVSMESGDVELDYQEYQILTQTAGYWTSIKGSSKNSICNIETENWVAICKVGKGHAILLADADLMGDEFLDDAASMLGGNDNMALIINLLKKLSAS